MRRALFILLLASACASNRPPTGEDVDAEMARATQDLTERKAELAHSASLQDCSRTCQLAALVCEASGRICDITTRHPERADFPPRCASARSSCNDAAATCQRCKDGGARP